MEHWRTVRNIAIIAAIAAAVQFLPGGGQVAEAFAAALWVVFGAGFGYFGYRTYRERRLSLYSLGQRHRALLYGGLALGFFTAAAQPRMWETGLGELLWFVMLAAAVWALVVVYRFSRTY
ncbi:MAG: hypothetical protein ACTHM1_09670 [Solirubrobacteraceae bacterium]